VRRWALVLLAALAGGVAPGCGRTGKPEAWIGDRAAVIRCTAAGPQRMPPMLVGLPVPAAPTGLLAHGIDPSSLDRLGYARDATVCAVLEAPPSDVIDEAGKTLPELVRAYDAVSREALRVGGRCTCEVARALGERDMIAACIATPTIAGCDVEERADEISRALDPLRDALASAQLPWIHWRLVGATDRPGWFADRLPDLLEAHSGGSTGFVRGQPLEARVEPLVRDLLALDDVVAVVRQDAGRALLVARERDGLLVLDHFAHPPMLGRLGPLVERLEQGRTVALVARLAAPVPSTAVLGRAEDGNFVEIDRTMLDELDRASFAAAVLLGEPFEPGAAKYSAPPVLVDRVLVQAPFGKDGRELRTNIDALGLLDGAPSWQPPPDLELELALRGTDTDAIMIHGLSRAPMLLRAIEAAHPGAVGGTLSSWRIRLEGGDPAPTLAGSTLARVREELAASRYEITVDLAESRTVLDVHLRPQ
jgi:hypothetical protein